MVLGRVLKTIRVGYARRISARECGNARRTDAAAAVFPCTTALRDAQRRGMHTQRFGTATYVAQ